MDTSIWTDQIKFEEKVDTENYQYKKYVNNLDRYSILNTAAKILNSLGHIKFNNLQVYGNVFSFNCLTCSNPFKDAGPYSYLEYIMFYIIEIKQLKTKRKYRSNNYSLTGLSPNMAKDTYLLSNHKHWSSVEPMEIALIDSYGKIINKNKVNKHLYCYKFRNLE